MKKQEAKKSKLWILLAACFVVLLVIVGLVLSMCSGPAATPTDPSDDSTGENTEPVAGEIADLYWNVDRELYAGQSEAGLSSRETAEDGYYHFTFAYMGEYVEMKVESRQLVNRIDGMKLMGLTVEDGIVTDVQAVEDITGGIVADGFYVEYISGQDITINSSETLNGLSMELSLGDAVQTYDVSPTAARVGMKSVLEVSDRVMVIQNTAGQVTHIYITSRPVEMDVYWNVARMWDSTNKRSTREPDENGEYSFLLAVNGEQVTLKSKLAAVATGIDEKAAKCFGLTFDDAGYITGVLNTSQATGGGTIASWYEVLTVEGNTFNAKKLIVAADTGSEAFGTLSDSCKILDVSGNGEFVGVATDLRVGDRIHGLTNAQGKVCVVFVVNRPMESPVYWNMERKYNSTTASTTRVPNAQGYYEFRLAHEGGNSVFKTKDKEIASAVDASAVRCFGLQTEGDIILKVYAVGSVLGVNGGSFGSWHHITSISGNFVQTLKDPNSTASDAGTTQAGFMTADCKVYNVTSAATVCGEVTELKVGDQIHALKDLEGNISLIFVLGGRTVNSPIYWNLNRQYNSTTKSTTRKPDANGWYVFDLAVNGKEITVRTASKAIASEVDSYAARCFGLKLDGTTITKVYTAKEVTGGDSVASWYDVEYWVSSNKFLAKKNTAAADTGKTVTVEMADNCVVYNVSDGYIQNRGEITRLKVGDRVHCLKNSLGKVVVIFVVSRAMEADVYLSYSRMYNSTTKETTRTPDANGWYVFRVAVNGGETTVRTKDKEIASQMDSYTVRSFGLLLTGDNNEVTRVFSASSIAGYEGGYVGDWGDVMSVKGNDFRVVKNSVASNNGKTWDLKLAKDCKIYDVSTYAENFGAVSTLEVGDRVNCLTNLKGEVTLVYIMSKNVHECLEHGSAYHYCEHCDQEVLWEPWNGTSAPTSSVTGHYYLTNDVSGVQQRNIGEQGAPADIVLCLNGHTYESLTRAFLVWYGSQLTIVDHSSDKVEEQGVVVGRGAELSKAGEPNHTGVILVTGKDSTLNILGGNYILAEDHNPITYSGVLSVLAGTTANLVRCNMFGGDIADGYGASLGGGVVSVAGTLNMGDVIIYGGTAYTGGNMTVRDNGVVNMYGGIIYGGTATLKYTEKVAENGTVSYTSSDGGGGNVRLNDTAVFNMYGGIIADGQTARTANPGSGSMSGGNGGNLYVSGTATFNMYGGNVTGGYSGNCGGNVALYGTLNLEDGAIDGGDSYSSGKNMFLVDGTTLNASGGTIDGQITLARNNADRPWANIRLSGTPVITNLALSNATGHTISVDGLKDGAKILVNTSGVFTDGTPEDSDEPYAKYFDAIAPVDGMEMLAIDGALAYGRYQCECGGALEGVEGHTCEKLLWSSTNTLPSTTGNYVLGADVTVTGQTTIASGAVIHLDLNGHTITGGGKSATRIYRDLGAKDGVTLTITDSSEKRDGKIVAANLPDGDQGGLIWFTVAGSKLKLYAGTLDASLYTSDWVSGSAPNFGGAPGVYLGSTATMEMYGGTVIGGTAAVVPYTNNSKTEYRITGGGAIWIDANAKVIMNGGTITGGKGKNGGNVFVRGTMEMNGGTITGGTATNTYVDAEGKSVSVSGYGGNVAVVMGGKFTMNGGEITDGVAGSYGGGNVAVYRASGTVNPSFTMTGGTISGGKANTGGNILMSNANVTAKGGVIEGGVSTAAGGNITMWDSGELTLTGDESGAVILRNGKAGATGGNISATKSTIIHVEKGAEISGGIANTNGTAISSQTITGYGANIHIAADADDQAPVLNIKDGAKILGGDEFNNPSINVAGRINGDKITTPVVNMTGGLVSGGKSNGLRGGNIRLYNYAEFNLSGGTVEGGQFIRSSDANGGNISIEANSVLNMSGGTVSGGVSNNQGGNIQLYGTLNMTDGTITGGTCLTKDQSGVNETSRSYNIFMVGANTANLNVSGGTIGGGVSVSSAKSISLSGVTVIDNPDSVFDLTLSSSFTTLIDATGLKEGSGIGVQFDGADRAFATVSDYTQKDYFFYNEYGTESHVITYEDGQLWKRISDDSANTVYGCECGGTLEGVEGHECRDIRWEKYTGSTVPTTTGNYILTGDLIGVGQCNIQSGAEIRIDLNGHTISSNSAKDSRLFSHSAQTGTNPDEIIKLTITDSSENHDGKLAVTGISTQGGVIWTRYQAEVNLYAGVIDASGLKTTGNGTAVSVISNSTFNMYGGTIIGGTSEANGGAVYVASGSTFNMYGGKIQNGTAKNGGNVTVYGVMNLRNGEITGGKANSGGNLLIDNGVVTISGGKLEGGEAIASNGGSICAWDTSVLTVTGDAVVTGGKAKALGGNIYFNKGTTFTVSGNAVISDGESATGAANIHSVWSAGEQSVTIEGNAKITGGKGVSGYGGVFIASDKTVTKMAGKITIDALVLGESNSSVMDATGLAEGAQIGIALGGADVTRAFATVTGSDAVKYFQSNMEGYTVKCNSGNQLYLSK